MSEEKNQEEKSARAKLPPKPKRRRLRAAVLGLLIFVGGMIFGSVLSLSTAHKMMLKSMQDPEHAHRHLMKKIKRELRLTPEQENEVNIILKIRLDILLELREKNMPRVKEQLDLVEKEVAEVLDQKQKKRWHKRCERMRKFLPPH